MTAIADHVRYNDLPSLGEANTSRQVVLIHLHPSVALTLRTFAQAPSVDGIINSPIRDVFLKHGAHALFCLYLQHRHHTVGADEAVVKVKATAHLLDGQAMKDIVSFGNEVLPTT